MLAPESGQGNAFVQISTYRFYCIWRFRTRRACSRAWHPAPGWYPGRTVHMHAKLHLETQTVLTTQFYFADDFTDRVFSREPYASATPATRFNDIDPLLPAGPRAHAGEKSPRPTWADYCRCVERLTALDHCACRAYSSPNDARRSVMRKQAQRKRSDRTPLRERLRARRDAQRTHRMEKPQAQATEWRHRDEHTGGYGDPTV